MLYNAITVKRLDTWQAQSTAPGKMIQFAASVQADIKRKTVMRRKKMILEK